MHDTEKFPLGINFTLTSQTESDVGKHRLHNSKSLAIAAATLRGINFPFHLLRVGLRFIGAPPCEKHHLARERALGMA